MGLIELKALHKKKELLGDHGFQTGTWKDLEDAVRSYVRARARILLPQDALRSRRCQSSSSLAYHAPASLHGQ
jgi:hypothetical protein